VRPSELEAWALLVADAAVRGDPIEHDRVELKTTWPETPAAAARRLAAHANAAGGETVLWLIGVDERARAVRGAEPNELANWLPAVQAQFRGPTPSLLRQGSLRHSGHQIVALLFATDRAPYVVLNPASGKPEAGPVELEVPWREGTRTRSAHHEDLIRILEPAARVPTIEPLRASVTVSDHPSINPGPFYWWDITAHLYFTSRNDRRVVIPLHHCAVALQADDQPLDAIAHHLILERPPKRGLPWDASPPANHEMPGDSITVTATESELVLDGPGAVRLRAVITSKIPAFGLPAKLTLAGEFTAIDAPAAAVFSIQFREEQRNSGQPLGGKPILRRWEYQAKGKG